MPSQNSESTPNRRKASKRRIDSDFDSDEDGDSDPLNISPRKESPIGRKRATKAVKDRPQVNSQASAQAVIETATPSQPRVREPTPPSKFENGNGTNKKVGRPKKKRVVVESEDEDEGKSIDDTLDSPYRPTHAEDEEPECSQEPKQSEVPAKQKGPLRRKPTKRANPDPVNKGKRGRAKKETKEIAAKNGGEDSAATIPAQSNPVTPSIQSRLKEDSTEGANATDEVLNPSATSASEPAKVPTAEIAELAKDATPSQPPPLPVKRKLPTIKKMKAPVSGNPVPPVSSDAAEVSKLPAVETRIVAANVGSADFDLRKPSVYAELFKAAGGNTPRSGLNRREKDEERRRELNKMKVEARAKRATEATRAFDLQAQWDKISRFEERLRREKSSVLFPNFLAAKFKDDWERQRRTRSGQKRVAQEKASP